MLLGDGGGGRCVSLRIVERNARLEVVDDGPGLPAGFSISGSSSLGLRLAHSLAEQLHGALAWGEGPGARFIATFRIDAPSEA